MIYCLSDIHGNYEKYKKILKLIRFSSDDTLYILGDVIDRGAGGLAILRDMMFRPNVIPILGNHEYMALSCLKWLSKEINEETLEQLHETDMSALMSWIENGGQPTINEFQRLSREDREDILEYIKDFSLYEEIIAGGRQFILVHAGPDNFLPERPLYDYALYELLFTRLNYNKVYYQNKYLVTGHTPTRLIYAAQNHLPLDSGDIISGKYDHIYQKHNHIAIDCGCGHGGRLAAVCLDTLEEFYAD